MRLTPIDIRKQQFRRAMRGYDVDEVDTFMAMVADEMEDLITSAQKAKDEVDQLRQRLDEYQQMETTMRDALVTVQRAAEEKRDTARREAEIIIREAELQASKWIDEAHRSVRDVKKELIRLNGMRDAYVTRLKMLMHSQLDMLKMIERDEESPEETLDLFEQKLAAFASHARTQQAEATQEDANQAETSGDAPAVEGDDATPPRSDRADPEWAG